MTQTYDWPESLALNTLLAPLAHAEDSLARLDERLRRSPVATGLNARLAYTEACAISLAEGDLVHLEDLVLFDSGAFDGPVSPALSRALQTLHHWRKAQLEDPLLLLQNDQPGTIPAHPPAPSDHTPASPTPWRTVLNRSRPLPPVLAAALVWHAWLTLNPDPAVAWRAPLLAALTLKARQKTQSLLLPIDTGRRFAKYRTHPAHDLHSSITGFLEWIETAAIRTAKEHDNLLMADRLLRPALRARRRHSRLPQLLDLLLARPLISAPMAAKLLHVSPQAARLMLLKLGPPVRELSGRTRYRVWGIV